MPKNELYHHGIKGQRWGKRNGPPYPLNAQTHGTVVRSADREGSTGSKSTKKGKISGVKDHLLANSMFDKSDTGRESYRENLKGKAKTAAGMGIGAGVGAGIGAGVAALRKGNIKEGAVYGGLAGSALGSLAGTRSYIKSFKAGVKRHKEIREADRAKKGHIGGLPNENTKDNNTRSEAERKAKLKRRILIGAGIAAGVTGGALIGKKIYANRARQAASLVEQARANRASIQAAHDVTTDALNKRSKDLNRIRSSLVNDRLQNQANSLELAKSKSNGLSSILKRRRINKNIDRIDKKLLENTKQRETVLNSWKASKATVDAASQGVNNATNAANALKRRGLRGGIAASLGLGAAGGYAGYRANTGLEINDYVNKNKKKRKRR